MIPLYFDPGTGALIVQMLAAVGAGVALFYNRIKSGVRSLFGKKKHDDMGGIEIEEHENDGERK